MCVWGGGGAQVKYKINARFVEHDFITFSQRGERMLDSINIWHYNYFKISFLALKGNILSLFMQCCYEHHFSLVATKPVFGVSDKMRFKPACSATETSLKIEISLVASLDMVLSKQRSTKALIRLRGWAGWSAPMLFANPRRQVFSHRSPFYNATLIYRPLKELKGLL